MTDGQTDTQRIKEIPSYLATMALWGTKRKMDIVSGEAILSKLLYLLSGKGSYCSRTEAAPLGIKFFPFRVDPFPEGALCAGKQVTIVVSLVRNGVKSIECIQLP